MIEDFIVFATNGERIFMIEDFIVFATNGFYDRGLHCLCNKCFVMIEDFIVFATNGFL